MSNEIGRRCSRHLADYLREMIGRVERWEPDRTAAIRATVGNRRARIILGDEAATIRFEGERFIVRKVSTTSDQDHPPPYGRTDRQTVVAILAGFLEVSEAIMEGRVDLRGATDDVIDMCAVVEMLIDSSTRIPELQQLAREFREDPKTDAFRERRQLVEQRARRKEVKEMEVAVLQRHRLV